MTLSRLSPVVSRERRARRARLAFAGEAPAPGRTGELVWRVVSGRLPAGLLSRRDGRLGVFLHEDGRAVFHPLPAAQEGRPAAIDLPEDREVIVQGQQRLQDGELISVR